MTVRLAFNGHRGSRLAAMPLAAKAAIVLLPLVSALPFVAQSAAKQDTAAKTRTEKGRTGTIAASPASALDSARIEAQLAKFDSLSAGGPSEVDSDTTEITTVRVGSAIGFFATVTRIDARGIDFVYAEQGDDWVGRTLCCAIRFSDGGKQPARLAYGEVQGIEGGIFDNTRVTVEKGRAPGTAIVKITHQAAAQDSAWQY